MEIDYIQMAKLIDIRLKQIDDASKEYDYYNKEFNELKTIRKSVSELIIIERKGYDNFTKKPQDNN